MIYNDDDDDAGDFSAHALQQLSLYSLQGNIESDYDADDRPLGPTRVWRLSRNIPLRQRQGGASCMWDLDKAFTLRRVIGEYIRL